MGESARDGYPEMPRGIDRLFDFADMAEKQGAKIEDEFSRNIPYECARIGIISAHVQCEQDWLKSQEEFTVEPPCEEQQAKPIKFREFL